jgi:hypothetical protein
LSFSSARVLHFRKAVEGKVMYKTVNFNIFEELLEEIVYGKKSAAQTETVAPAKKTTVTKIGEITIQKITDRKTEPLVYKNFEMSAKKF